MFSSFLLLQAKVDHLIQQNKELADHVTWLVDQVKTNGSEPPQLPPTKRTINNDTTQPLAGNVMAPAAAAEMQAQAMPPFAATADPLSGFDDSFVPLPTTVSVQHGQAATVTMPAKKVTSSDDSESDSDDEEVNGDDGRKSAMTTGTDVSPTPYGRLGDSTTDEDVDSKAFAAAATTTTAAGVPLAKSDSLFAEISAADDPFVQETQKLTFEMS